MFSLILAALNIDENKGTIIPTKDCSCKGEILKARSLNPKS